ncbi:RNA polymerase factor sigma-54 [Chitinophagaceae bacterium LWZ2-11]
MLQNSIYLAQKQQHKIIPQQIEYLHLLQVNHIELQQQINNMLEENPFLEKHEDESEVPLNEKPELHGEEDYKDWDEYGYEDHPDYKMEHSAFFSEENTPNKQWKTEEDFKIEVIEQMQSLPFNKKQKELATTIIYYLNDEGMLEYDIPALVDDLGFRLQKFYEEEEVGQVLKYLRTLDPVGIFSCSIQECLIAQLERMNTKRPDVKKALQLLRDHYQNLKKKNFIKIYDELDIDGEEFTIILNLIAKLSLKPLTLTSASEKLRQTVIPDFIITFEDNGSIAINLYRSFAENLYVNNRLQQTLPTAGRSCEQKQTEQYIKSKIKSAEWFVQCVKQRECTMLSVMRAIVRKQADFFNASGDEKLLKPMILKHIAEEVGVDISTVSSITSTKYADTPFGYLPLKSLFTKAVLNDEGEAFSNKLLKKEIEELINNENKHEPYTDQHIVYLLEQKGYKIARRTVAKYREMMNIPVSYLRMSLSIAI